ncbi:hypothetical protein Pcinc_023106 [Petrolisthes cinctipes]|uniref:Uncharacterized protein n=1 Tax=Petrolisthes cinctipes TaxID=88211 RepID=A0AAE1KCN5_PETCI|nr:hypothetical protein Pcinc_023106 [Petrolisthes cinctipes]
MAMCSVAYIAPHKRQEVCRGVQCEEGPVKWGIMCELVTRAHLAGVSTSRSIWSHVAAALDLHQQPPPQEVVSHLMNGTVRHSLAAWAPRDPAHNKEVLMWLAEQWRTRGWPVPPEFCPEVVAIPSGAPELFYKTYLGLGGSEGVTLLESGGGITHNTTGLTSWCGSAVLAEWATNYPKVVAGRRVLELGAGVGLAACVLLTSPTPPAAYIATDCHHHVLHLLQHNLSLNLTTPPPKREDLEKFQEWMSEEVRRGEVEAGEVKPWTPPVNHTCPLKPSNSPVQVVRCGSEEGRDGEGEVVVMKRETCVGVLQVVRRGSEEGRDGEGEVVVMRRETCIGVVRRGSEEGRDGEGEVVVMQVDWRDPPRLPPVDVVVAADVVYDVPLIPPLLALIRCVLDGSALENSSEDDTRVVTRGTKTGTQMEETDETDTEIKTGKTSDVKREPDEGINTVVNGEEADQGTGLIDNNKKVVESKNIQDRSEMEWEEENKKSTKKGTNTRGRRESQGREAYLACTRRSQETMLVFLEEAGKAGLTTELVYQNCLDADRALFVYNEMHLPIKVYKLTLAGCES